MANPPAAASVPVATAVSESPAASSGSGGNQPALPGWEERIMSAVNTPAGSQLAPQAGQFCSREQQQGDSATSRSISLGETSSYSQSLQKLESGILPQVMNQTEISQLNRGTKLCPSGLRPPPRAH